MFPDTKPVIDGYVRLSRDDNRRSYTSIENQKKIILQYAAQNGMTVRHIYEDDGFSGYSFDRPGFREMMDNLDSIRILAAKDLSRIGRHNARVLLFLEEMEELGKRVILIDDNYDSFSSDDDIIGIKTWDNERHVKSTSRKVKRIKKMEQESGTLKSVPPFGYTWHPLNHSLLLIDEEAAAILTLEKDLYLAGNGIRKIAEILTDRGVPTPTMLKKERCEALGLPYRRKAADVWSYSMVKDTLFNDFHNGVLRTHKRERATINGKDKKVPEEKQYVFPGHHPKIFDDSTWNLLLKVKESRGRNGYRGQKKHKSLFSGCLYCKDCGGKMTAINRPGRKKYYVCGTYNKKGKRFCGASHTIMEETLVKAVIRYLAICGGCMDDALKDMDLSAITPGYSPANSQKRLEGELKRAREELKTMIAQKTKELTANPSAKELIAETYASLQDEKIEQISALKQKLSSLETDFPSPVQSSAPALFREFLEKKSLTRADIEVLVESIWVDQDGNADIFLRYGLPDRDIPAFCGTADSPSG